MVKMAKAKGVEGEEETNGGDDKEENEEEKDDREGEEGFAITS